MNNLTCIHIDINTYPFSDNFKSIMRYMSANCESMSAGIRRPDSGPVFGINTGPLFDWFPDKPNIKKILVLVFPNEIHDGYLRNPEYAKEEFISGIVLNHTIGHCYLTWDYTIGIIGLWDMCIHRKYLDTPGYGSKALTSIIDSLNMELPNYGAVSGYSTIRDDNMVVKIWLCVDMANTKFSNVVHLYAKHGFATPIVDPTDPFGNNWSSSFPNGLLCLSRNNEFIIPKDIDKENSINDIIYSIQEAIGNFSLVQTGSMNPIIGNNVITKSGLLYCNMSVKIDIENINLLRRFSNGSSTMNDDGTVTQKEISGSFLIKDNTVYTRFPYTMPNRISPGGNMVYYLGPSQMKPAMEIIEQASKMSYDNAKQAYEQISKSNFDYATKSRVEKIMTIMHNNYWDVRKELGYVDFIIPEGQVPGIDYLHVSSIPDTLPTVSPKIIVWDLIVNIDSLSYGTEEEVDVPDNKYSFHTHPKSIYNTPLPVPMDKITIGPTAPSRIIKVGHPSGRDYYGTLFKMLMYDITFHTVVAPTGLYIISLNPYWIQNSEKLKNMILSDDIGSSKEIPKETLKVWRSQAIRRQESAIDNTDINLLLDDITINNLVSEAILADKPLWIDMITNMYERYWGWVWEELSIDDSCRRYANICTQSKPLGFDQESLMVVQYKSWNDLEKGQLIDIQYKTIGRNCMTSEEDTYTYRRFYPSSK
jgi:hypothetical protein